MSGGKRPLEAPRIVPHEVVDSREALFFAIIERPMPGQKLKECLPVHVVVFPVSASCRIRESAFAIVTELGGTIATPSRARHRGTELQERQVLA